MIDQREDLLQAGSSAHGRQNEEEGVVGLAGQGEPAYAETERVNAPEGVSTRAGYIALVGRPNVGKSTLLNRILGRKVTITAHRAQTTRQQVLGIKTGDDTQAIYVDIPGIDLRRRAGRMSSYFNRVALNALDGVDVIVFVVAGTSWRDEDEAVLKRLLSAPCPVILGINKVDLVVQKNHLLEHISKIQEKLSFKEVVPFSARSGSNVATLERVVEDLLPVGPWLFPKEQHTDRDERFWIAEVVREKITRLFGQELPYAISVEVEQLELVNGVVKIAVIIYVERDGQKIIIVGKGGEGLKQVGTLARQDLEKFFGKIVYLRLWVKVKRNWTRNAQFLKSLGYE